MILSFFRRCLSSCSRKNVLIKHKETCELQEIAAIKASIEYFFYRIHFSCENPLYFRIFAYFEADNEIDKSII